MTEVPGARRVQRGASRPIARIASFCVSLSNGAQGWVFDRLLGVSTRGGVVTDSSMFNSGGDNCPYSGSQWLPVRRVLKSLAPGPADVFVDLGSGKGKVLLIAGRLPYRRVVGIEIDEGLSRCAEHNIVKARHRLSAEDINSINVSVLEWRLPDDVSVVFMYNPFIGQTFYSAIDRIFESYNRKPRALHIVYGYPLEHDWLLSTGRVIIDNVGPSHWPALPRWWQKADVIISYKVVAFSEKNKSGSLSRLSVGRHRAIQYWSRPNSHPFIISAPDGKIFYSRS
jgi:SAM-dependent methyltransferase